MCLAGRLLVSVGTHLNLKNSIYFFVNVSVWDAVPMSVYVVLGNIFYQTKMLILFFVNNLIILAKHYIHRYRYTRKKPPF